MLWRISADTHRQRIGTMFKFIPNTAVPGFRVGRPDDDEFGFNVANDGSTPPVLPGAPDVPTVGDNYPFGATPAGFIAPQAPSPNPVAPLGSGSSSLPAASPATPDSERVLQLDAQGDAGGLTLARYGASDPLTRADPAGAMPNAAQYTSGDDGFQLARSAQ